MNKKSKRSFRLLGSAILIGLTIAWALTFKDWLLDNFSLMSFLGVDTRIIVLVVLSVLMFVCYYLGFRRG